MKIGILALQGSFNEHKMMLDKLGKQAKQETEKKQKIEAVEVRLPEQLNDIDGLIIPGGESTTLTQLLDKYNFDLKKFNKPIFGTCAGCIVLAKLGLLNINVKRNAYGSQLYSFVDDIEITFEKKGMKEKIKEIFRERFKCVFIRAPKIISAGENVSILGEHNNEPVLVKQGNILGATFHPELSEDTRVHRFFLDIVKETNFK
ncbi:pyridoxal 5'-phosphate synthase glutaminase subunit PdxT [Candidatus Woesearchaeota archaeon]|nr:pyridoxal 5'-phosphate synthase glutaminase subunit PdxT [Candidatus Woesearchaeota archaeon]